MQLRNVGLISAKNVERVTIEHVCRITIKHISEVISKPANQNSDKVASMNIYLIRYIKHDEDSTINLKYFLRYVLLLLTLRPQTGCIILWCKFDSYECVLSCLSGKKNSNLLFWFRSKYQTILILVKNFCWINAVLHIY